MRPHGDETELGICDVKEVRKPHAHTTHLRTEGGVVRGAGRCHLLGRVPVERKRGIENQVKVEVQARRLDGAPDNILARRQAKRLFDSR